MFTVEKSENQKFGFIQQPWALKLSNSHECSIQGVKVEYTKIQPKNNYLYFKFKSYYLWHLPEWKGKLRYLILKAVLMKAKTRGIIKTYIKSKYLAWKGIIFKRKSSNNNWLISFTNWKGSKYFNSLAFLFNLFRFDLCTGNVSIGECLFRSKTFAKAFIEINPAFWRSCKSLVSYSFQINNQDWTYDTAENAKSVSSLYSNVYRQLFDLPRSCSANEILTGTGNLCYATMTHNAVNSQSRLLNT